MPHKALPKLYQDFVLNYSIEQIQRGSSSCKQLDWPTAGPNKNVHKFRKGMRHLGVKEVSHTDERYKTILINFTK